MQELVRAGIYHLFSVAYLMLASSVTNSQNYCNFDFQVLSEPRKFWIRDTTNKIYSILSDTPPEGDKFVQHIKSILKYEEKWSKWKNEGCPSLSKAPDKVRINFISHKCALTLETMSCFNKL